MSLKLGLQNRALDYYPVCSNDDLRLTFLSKGHICSFRHLYGKRLGHFWKLLKTKGILFGTYITMNILVYQRSMFHVTKMAAMPIYGNAFEILILHNPIADVI